MSADTDSQPAPSTLNQRFVGRELELKRMHEIVSDSIEKKSPIFIRIVGDFGEGKTSLVNQFFTEIDQKYPNILIGRGICSEGSDAKGYLPFWQLLESLSRQGSLRKVINDWGQFIIDEAPAWADIFSASMPTPVNLAFKTMKGLLRRIGPKNIRQETVFEQFLKAINDLGKNRPIVVFVDDLQWADADSLSLLDFLSQNIKSLAFVFICAYRPSAATTSTIARKFIDTIAKIGRNDPRAEILLTQGIDVEEYVRQRYPLNTFPVQLLQLIQQNTQGHPLFLESLFTLWQSKNVIQQECIHSGKITWRISKEMMNDSMVPPNIGAVLEQRMSLLEDNLKELLEIASVEGEEFTEQVLAQVIGDSEEIVDKNLQKIQNHHALIQELGTQEFGDILIEKYRFLQRFFREYIYERISARSKRDLHLKVAETLGALFENQRDFISGKLAIHYQQAHLKRKAADYALMAARFEQTRYSWAESERWCEIGLGLVEDIKPEGGKLSLKIGFLQESGDSYYKSGQFTLADQRYREAIRLAERSIGMPEKVVELYIELADLCEYEGNYDDFVIYLGKANDLVRENSIQLSPSALYFKLRWLESVISHRNGDNQLIITQLPRFIDEAKHNFQSEDVIFVAARMYNLLAMALKDLSRFEEAKSAYQQAIDLLERLNEIGLAAAYKVNLSELYRCEGLYEKGLDLALNAFHSSEKVEDWDTVQYAKGVEGSFLLDLGKYPEALSELNEALRFAEKCGTNWYLPNIFSDLALTYLHLGNVEAARQFAVQAISSAKEIHFEAETGIAYDTLGQVESSCGNWQAAEKNYNEAISIFNKIADPRRMSQAQFHQATIWLKQEKIPQAKEILNQALSIFQKLNLHHESEKVRNLLGTIKET